MLHPQKNLLLGLVYGTYYLSNVLLVTDFVSEAFGKMMDGIQLPVHSH